jgi:N-acetylglucosaminyldiphosphoundecaprenol N-acetyl-beta-D-mannosaminyltransferase
MTERRTFRRILKRIRKETLYIFGVRVDNIDVDTALESVEAFTSARPGSSPRRVYFTNVHTIQLARKDPEYRRCINEADMVLADGSGLKIAGRAFGTPIRENLNGTDLAPKVLRYAENRGRTVYLLGARPEVIEACIRRLGVLHPALNVVGSHPGFFTPAEEQEIIGDINAKNPDILLVALGSPRQELWIAEHRAELSARVCFGVGGLFDFIAGAVRRAPACLRAIGLEWLYRFFQDPLNKWNRVVVEIPSFLALVLFRRLIPDVPAESFTFANGHRERT